MEPPGARVEVDEYPSLGAGDEEALAVGVSLVGRGWDNFPWKDSNCLAIARPSSSIILFSISS